MKNTLMVVGVAVLAGAAGMIAGVYLAHAHTPRMAGSTRLAPHASVAPAQRKILYWWDPMLGKSSISSKPGISAMGMKLIPVYASRAGTTADSVLIDPAITQDMGIRTAKATLGPLTKTINTIGYVRQSTPAITNITLRVSGYIGTLYAAIDGQQVMKGERLFTLYSPKLLVAQQEMLAAWQAWQAAKKSHEKDTARENKALFHALVHRLLNLGVAPQQVAKIVSRGAAQKYLLFQSPMMGVVENLRVHQRSAVSSGATLMQIACHNALWIDAHVYDQDLPWVKMGDRMKVQFASMPGKPVEIKVSFISPIEDSVSHTVAVRGNITNFNGVIRPGMYARVELQTQAAKKAILIPRDAVIETGTKEIVFIKEAAGHFDPVRVKTGLAGDHGLVEVLSGIGPGEEVVTSGEFLVDVESQIRSVLPDFTAPPAAPK